MPPADDREASVEPNVVRELNCHAAQTSGTRVHRHGAWIIFAEGGRDILGPIGCDAPSRMATSMSLKEATPRSASRIASMM